MKKTNKLIVATSLLMVTVLGIFGISQIENITLLKGNVNSHVQAYNHNPNNILDNVFKQNGMTILPFILKNSDSTISTNYVKSQFSSAGQTINSITADEIIKTGTTIKTNSNTYNVVIYGDVDGDGYVDVFDAQAVLRHYVFAGNYELKGVYNIASNVDNEDEEIDVFDAQRILRFYVGYETKLVVNEPVSIKEQDSTKPVITLNGSSTVTVNLGSTYTELGATATDNIDGNITSKIKVSSNVNTNTEGTYTVTYTVTDNAGNTATANRTVKVVDYMTSITLTAPTNIDYKYGQNVDFKNSNMVVQKVMKSGIKVPVANSECTITGYNNTTLEEQTITVTYEGKTATFKVKVDNYIKDIELTTKPTKLLYVEGEEVDLTGISINAIMANNTRQPISSDDLSINPRTNISYSDSKIELTYTTTDTIDNSSKEFKVSYDIEVKKKLSTLVVSKIQGEGYAHEEFEYGTVVEGENEEELDLSKVEIKYQVLNEADEDITSQEKVLVRFEKEVIDLEARIIVKAQEAGIYKIKLYVGENIDTATANSEVQTIEITNNPTIKSISIENFENVSIRVNEVIERKLIIKNIYDDILEITSIDNVEVIATDVEVSLLDSNNNPGTDVANIQIRATTPGRQEIKIKINKGTENEKTISLGYIQTLAELEKTLDVENTTSVTLLQEDPLEVQSNIALVNGKRYTLIPVKLIENETNREIAIKADELIVGEATEEKPFSVTYTNNYAYDLLNIAMFKDKNIVTTSVDANYLGVALGTGISKDKIGENNKLVLKYNDSEISLDIKVEDLNIKTLVIEPKNIDEVSKIPTIENHVQTSIGIITSGDGERDLLEVVTQNPNYIKYKVLNEQEQDITDDGIVEVTIAEMSNDAGNLQVLVETKVAGIYTIIPYITDEILVKQKIESYDYPIISEVEHPITRTSPAFKAAKSINSENTFFASFVIISYIILIPMLYTNGHPYG